MVENNARIDFDRLLRLRLVVARHGEMDAAQWWNTQGVLSRRGSSVYKRGLPRTHFFAQARVVFAVARARCQELFAPPKSMTLWHLPAEIEDQFEDHWQQWIDDGDNWMPMFEKLSTYDGNNLLGFLRECELITDEDIKKTEKLRRSSENRAVPIQGIHRPSDEIITLLAAGFARGETGNAAIPYTKLQE